MSFFKKMLAKVGIGNIDIDAQFHTEQFIPGGYVDGVVVATGGNVEQTVRKLYFRLMTEYYKPVERDANRDGRTEIHYEKQTVEIANFVLGESLVFRPGETKEIPFSLVLPHHTPISIGEFPIWIRTGLDIDNAVDPTDRDDVEILAHPYTSILFKALELLGFQMSKAENEYYPQHNYALPFIQKFEFEPTLRSRYKNTIDELEIVAYPNEGGIEIILELDRKARGFNGFLAEMLDMDETVGRFSFSSEELDEGPSFIAEQLSSIFNDLV